MRKNVLLKSMFRQPMRLVVLFALIALAAFAGVLRTAEFMIVRDQINETAGHYRTTGFVEHPERFGDVSAAIELLADDPRIAVQDNRRSAQAYLTDMTNADVTGMHELAWNFRTARNMLPTITETYFYAYVGRMWPQANVIMTL